MMRHPLLSRFELIVDSAESIQQIRKLVIHLAIGGKLCSDGQQSASAQIVSELASARNALVKGGRLTRLKVMPPIDESELPVLGQDVVSFQRLGTVAVLEKGLTGIQSATPGKYPLVVTATERATCDHFDFEGAAAIIPLVSSTGHGNASIKRLHYQTGKFALGNILCAVFSVCDEWLSTRFLFEYLTAFKEELLVSRMIGTANVTLTLGKIAEVPVPIVSPEAQRRVDELMALCDRLEEARKEREARRDRLTAASLHHLNNAAPGEDLRNHARFFINHLPKLTARPDQMGGMRQCLIDLASLGRLVPQSAHEEPALELVERLTRERNHWVAANGKNRVLRGATPSDTHEYPFVVPDGWVWVELGDLLKGDSLNGYGLKPDDDPNGIPILRISAGTVRSDGLVAEEEYKLIGGVTVEQQEKYSLSPGDLLACRFNGNQRFVGRLSLYTGYLGLRPIYPDKLIRLRLFPEFVLPDLVRYFAESDWVRKEIEAYCATTVGNWGISASSLKRVRIPIPPLAEQRRIVERLELLLKSSDALENHLVTRREGASQLATCVLADSTRAASAGLR